MNTTTSAPTAAPAQATTPTPQEIDLARQRLRAEQNLPMGLLFGTVASLAGAGLWAAITAATGFQIGWMAVGVGVLVGIAMRKGGRGMDPMFGVAGAALSLVGCVAGNLLAGCVFVAANEGTTFLQVLASLDSGLAFRILSAMASPIDLLFYGIALYEGYRLSLRSVSDEDLMRTLGRTGSRTKTA